MRVNMPITQKEYVLNEGMTIVSTTDLQGNINYANQYFIEVSGFLETELLGAPQNILRHPDMPAEAFADLWDTIKTGMPWTGMVKNRCKNGDFYWVFANITPRHRERPSDRLYVRAYQAYARADQRGGGLYKSFKDGNTARLAFRNGRVVRQGWAAKLAEWRKLTCRKTWPSIASSSAWCWPSSAAPCGVSTATRARPRAAGSAVLPPQPWC